MKQRLQIALSACASTAVRCTALLGLVLFPVLAGATTLGSLAGSMSPGGWAVLNTGGDGSGFSSSLIEVELPGHILQFADKGMWYAGAQQVFFVGQGHLASMKIVSYTDSANHWQQEPKPPWDQTTQNVGICCGGVGHGYNHSTMNPGTGDLFVREYGSKTVHKFTRATGQWTNLPDMPQSLPCCGALEYFPERGGLVAVGGGTVLFYKEATSTWTTQSTTLTMGPYHNVAYYSAANHVVLFGGGNGSSDLYQMNAAGGITKVKNAPIAFGISNTVNTVDPASGRMLVFTINGNGYEFDPAGNNWIVINVGTTGATGDTTWLNDGVMATPISTYGVILFMRHSGTPKVWLYKHAAGAAAPPDNTPPSAPGNVKVQ